MIIHEYVDDIKKKYREWCKMEKLKSIGAEETQIIMIQKWEREYHDDMCKKIIEYFPKLYHKLHNFCVSEYTFEYQQDRCFYSPYLPTDVSKCGCFTIEDVIKSSHTPYTFGLYVEWCMRGFSMNPNVKIEDVVNYPKLGWNMFKVSLHPNIKIQDVINHPHLEWDMFNVSLNPNMTMDIVMQYPQIPWDSCGISLNINTTIDVVKKYPDYPWSKGCLLENPNMTLTIIKANPSVFSCYLDYRRLSRNMGIATEDIIDNLDEGWDWQALMEHPSMNWKVIKACSKKMLQTYRNIKQDPFAKFLVTKKHYSPSALIETLVKRIIEREKPVYLRMKIQRFYTIYLRKICDKHDVPYDVIERVARFI